jgi:mevalonate kinase
MHKTMPTAVSPAKFILFGEHAVVYGEPAIAVAIELPMKVTAEPAEAFTVDGEPLNPRYHSYIKTAFDRHWEGGPVALTIDSEVPRASGLGSSAAVTVASIVAIKALGGMEMTEEELARDAYEVECEAQKGKASPTDTSVCTHGRAIMLRDKAGKNLLWNIKKGEKSWFIHHLDIPEMTFVIGNTKVRGKTPVLVEKVRRYYTKSGHARETIADIGNIALEGAKALEKGDLTKVGELMDLNHRRLASLGVSHPRLEKLVKIVAPFSMGAKLTGAGGGGCMIALTEEPKKVVNAIRKVGGEPMVVTPARKGARVLKK